MTNSDLMGFTGDLTNKRGNYWDGCGYNNYIIFYNPYIMGIYISEISRIYLVWISIIQPQDGHLGGLKIGYSMIFGCV